MELSDKYIELLRCIDCDGSLTISKLSTLHKKLICTKCDLAYEVKNNKIFFAKHYFKQNSWQNVGDKWPNLGEISKKYKPNKIYGPKIKDLSNYLNIYNELGLVYIGSGNDRIKGFIHVDLGDYKNVDIVADIGNMPFKSEKLDLIVSNSTLEHIYDYKPIITEAYRTLKLGGYIYMCVPNLCPRHHTVDYFRWTMAGLIKLFDEFQIVESGACRGYADAINVIGNWLIGDKIENVKLKNILHPIWNIVTRPLYWGANNSEISIALSQTIYIIAKKQ